MAEDLRIVTTVENEAEAEMVGEWLTEAGIQSMPQIHAGNIRLGAAAPRDVYVHADDYDRAVEVINAEVPSEAELTALSEQADDPAAPREE
jgi:Putative prokaryotic signal transducing protein